MLIPSYAGVYSVSTIYNAGDFVVYGGKLYQAQSQNLGATPILNSSVWTLVSSSFSMLGNWNANTSYSVGQVISYANTFFLSLANTNTGNQPNISTTTWRTFGNTSSIITLQPGDLQYQGNTSLQRLPIANVGQVLTVANNGLPIWANTVVAISNTSNLVVNSVTSNTATLYSLTTNTITSNTATLYSLTTNTITSNTFLYPNGESPGYTYALDDISSYFDGIATSFMLTYNGIPITSTNPNQVQVQIGNVPVYANSKAFDYFNITTEIYTQQNGFTLTGNTITFATAPLQGMSFYGTYRTSADQLPPFYLYQVPFAPLNIMLS
jgi:hypothetical protein